MSKRGARARPRGTTAGALSVLVALGLSSTVSVAYADLRDVAYRARAEWHAAGGTLFDVPTRFLFEDESIAIRLPPGANERCTSIGLVGSRGMSFHVEVPGEHEGDEAVARASSVAGILELSRCNGTSLDRFVVTSDAGRGAIEIVVARSRAELPSLRSVYPERTGGLFPPMPEPGALPPLPSAEKRADAAEARVRPDGAAVLPRKMVRAEDDGTGGEEIHLETGCHRLELFATELPTAHGSRRARLDLDAEIRDSDDDTLLARDRSEAADARLETCVGGPTLGEVVFAGTTPGGQVLLTHAAWPLPDLLPRLFGTAPRARMGRALLARHLHAPREEPLVVAQGPAGATPVFLDVEPGACYLAVAAVVRGNSRGLGLRAVVGATESQDDHGPGDDAAVVAFCARDQRRARIEVDARGASLAWGMAVYRTMKDMWEAPR